MPHSQFEDLAPYYDELMDVVPYEFWAEYVVTLFNFVGCHPQTLLDCACGTGNLSYELAKLGFQVTGIDLSQPMILEALKKAALIQAAFPTQFFQGDLTSFNLERTFDAATCLYDSLNYILWINDLQKAFCCVRKHLKPGGIFIFDMNSEWAFEANLFTQRSTNPKKSLHYEWRSRFDQESRVCTVSMNFKKKSDSEGEVIFRETHQERAYSIQEVQSLIDVTGWQLLHVFDAYTLNRPHRRSERWFFVVKAV
jgi:SAM-dependent methyltransferase